MSYAGCVKIILPKVTQDKQASKFIDFVESSGTLFNVGGTKLNLWPMKIDSNFITEEVQFSARKQKIEIHEQKTHKLFT